MGCSRSLAIGARKRLRTSPSDGSHRMDAAVRSPLSADIPAQAAPSGKWAIVAMSEFDLSCCMTARDAIYVGTDDARMLRLRHGDGVLNPIDGFDSVAGRETWFAGSAIVNGQRVGPPLGIRSVAANSDGSILFANVHVGGIPRSIGWRKNLAAHHRYQQRCS